MIPVADFLTLNYATDAF